VTAIRPAAPAIEVDAAPVPEAPSRDFDAFVHDCGPRLGRVAFLLTGDHQLAEDLVQTALAKVVRQWGRIAERGDPLPYVRTVVVNTAIGWRRRRWRGEHPTGRLPEVALADGTAGVDDRERLRRALLELPTRQRAAVALRFYEDLPEAEVARLLGCSVGTVKSQTAKGLEKLRSILGDGAR
jgi:RNA polymerase sigma-70 factor (sigma-E family)